MDSNDISLLILGMVFGTIGWGFFSYGRKQKRTVPLFVGVALFILPYIITNLYLMIGIGVLLTIIPYFIKL